MRRNRPGVFHKVGVPKNFEKDHRKTPIPESFLIKLPEDPQLYQKRDCFPVNFAKFLRASILMSNCEWLLLKGVQRMKSTSQQKYKK